jgi:hypothetical protein
MDQETTGLLLRLREAILESLNSNNIEESIVALERSGYRVFVSVDAVPDQAGTVPEAEGAASFTAGPCILSPSDELFLRSLHIGF